MGRQFTDIKRRGTKWESNTEKNSKVSETGAVNVLVGNRSKRKSRIKGRETGGWKRKMKKKKIKG